MRMSDDPNIYLTAFILTAIAIGSLIAALAAFVILS